MKDGWEQFATTGGVVVIATTISQGIYTTDAIVRVGFDGFED